MTIIKWIPAEQKPLQTLGWLGAPCPAVVQKWIPDFCKNWDSMSEGERQDALAEANYVEKQYQQQLSYWRNQAPNVCDATKPGILADALREYLVKMGGDKSQMNSDGEAFGSLDLAEWKRVMGTDAPSSSDAAKAFGAPWSYGGKGALTLNVICNKGVTLPKPSAPPVTVPVVEPPDTTTSSGGTSKKSNWGILALVGSLIGAIWYGIS